MVAPPPVSFPPAASSPASILPLPGRAARQVTADPAGVQPQRAVSKDAPVPAMARMGTVEEDGSAAGAVTRPVEPTPAAPPGGAEAALRAAPGFEPLAPVGRAGAAEGMPGSGPSAPPSETPPVARQMAAALSTNEGRVDLRLDPEELGRVGMRIQAEGDKVTVSIAVERPETGDLIRRHLQDLSQELRALGYRSVGFSFEGGGQDARQGGDASLAEASTGGGDDAERSVSPGQATASSAPAPARAAARSGLDLLL